MFKKMGDNNQVITNLDNFQDVNELCYDDLKPGQDGRPSNYEYHTCCKHYFMKKQIKNYLKPPTGNLSHENQYLCICNFSLTNHNTTVNNFCCLHRTKEDYINLL